MHLGLIGFGKMGQSIEKLAESYGHTIGAIIDPSSSKATHRNLKELQHVDIDAFIDFSNANQTSQSIEFCIKNEIPLVIGTTGFEFPEKRITSLKQSKTGILYASNFSIGVHIFSHLVEKAAKIASCFDDFDIAVREVHHNEKVDSPSGTALSIAEKVLENSPHNKKKLLLDRPKDKIASNHLHVTSTRLGSCIGIHEVMLSSPHDLIEIKHSSISRDSYAKGAITAALWLQGKEGFFTIDDLLKDYHYA